jgi:hypothetical protein
MHIEGWVHTFCKCIQRIVMFQSTSSSLSSPGNAVEVVPLIVPTTEESSRPVSHPGTPGTPVAGSEFAPHPGTPGAPDIGQSPKTGSAPKMGFGAVVNKVVSSSLTGFKNNIDPDVKKASIRFGTGEPAVSPLSKEDQQLLDRAKWLVTRFCSAEKGVANNAGMGVFVGAHRERDLIPLVSVVGENERKRNLELPGKVKRCNTCLLYNFHILAMYKIFSSCNPRK